MLLLKTHAKHMAGVRRYRKHATDGRPRDVDRGDWLLIQVTSGAAGNQVRRIRYAMRYADCYPDQDGESERIWGTHWTYIVRGVDFRILRHPFDIEQIQVSAANYGQGVIRFAYVDPADEAEIIRRGLLEPA